MFLAAGQAGIYVLLQVKLSYMSLDTGQAGIYESCYSSSWHIWVLLQVMLSYTGLSTGQAGM